MDERNAYIALNMMEKVGPVGVRALVEALGSAAAVFSASETALRQAEGIGRESAQNIIRQRDTIDWAGELDRTAALGAHIVTPLDAEYPEALSKIYDPPLALYVWGALERRDRHGVAVVGTRRPTLYGRETTDRLSYQIAKAGLVVISGLAEGVDTVAHRAALRAGGRTLAVLGSALDCIYPPGNQELAAEIARHGAVLSEYALGRQPDKTTFPVRNRIVSGLSMGVLVVEADLKSGARITATQALEQGRSVFAVPGRIDSPASRGTNDLIKHGAKLVAGIEDVLTEFEYLIPTPAAEPATGMPAAGGLPRGLSADEAKLAGLLLEGEREVDVLIRTSGLTPAAVGALLIGLEMKRVVRMLPGRMVALRRESA